VRIGVLDDYQGVARELGTWDRLPDAELEVLREHVDDPDALAARLQGCTVVVVMRERTPVTAALLDALPDLRLLVTTGRQNASVDVAAAHARGIVVCGTDSDLTGTVELTWGLVLALARSLPQEDAAVRAGGWQSTLGTGLAGSVLGVVGLGRIGAEVARLGLAFGMDVVAWSQHLTDEAAQAVGVRRVERDALLASADVVTLHLRLSPRTTGLIGAAELDRMKDSALLVNTSRGPLVDEAALLTALHEGRIGGAALDVYDREPLPAGAPLRTAPRTVLSPHLGYVTRQNYAVFYAQAVEDVEAFLAGAPVRTLTA
jgi:phosphoglycerate dehydrogenase-like enzyme